MPQMAPLNWMLMFMLIIILLMIFSSLIYFSFNYMPKKLNFKFKIPMNWKW